MTDDRKTLEPLRSVLPDIPERPEIDEDGEEVWPGFSGDISQVSRYVTDGRLLLLADAIDPSFAVRRDEDSFIRKYATEAKLDSLWKEVCEREDRDAAFLGCGVYGPDGSVDVAFVRDDRGRLMVVAATRLAYAVKAARPDRLSVVAADVADLFPTSLALYREGALIGILMPMRFRRESFPQYDLDGPAASLTVESARA